MELTAEHCDLFIAHVREGKNRQQAAREVAAAFGDDRISATRFKFLCSREPAFARLYESAIVEGRGTMVDNLEACCLEMALGGHWPALKFMLTTYGEAFAWARSSKVEVGGTVEIQAIAGILAKYLPAAEYDKLIEVVEQKMIEEQSLVVA